MFQFLSERLWLTAANYVQKFLACVSISAMVAFVAFTIVSARELSVANCKHVDEEGGHDEFDDYKAVSTVLFVWFFAMVTAVAWARDALFDDREKEKETRLEVILKYIGRLCLGEGLLLFTGYVLAMTITSKCPLTVGTSNTTQMDATFIDEAADVQGTTIVAFSGIFCFQIIATGVSTYLEDRKTNYGKRDYYENVALFVAFVLMCIGSAYTAHHYEKDDFHSVSGFPTGTDLTIFSAMCKDEDTGPNMDYAQDDNTAYIALAVLSGLHAAATLVVNIDIMGRPLFEKIETCGKYKTVDISKFIRSVIESIVQIAIAITGIFAIAPLVFVLKNPPCNYTYGKFLHDDDGARSVTMMILGYVLFTGIQTMKIYRDFAKDPESMSKLGKAMLLG